MHKNNKERILHFTKELLGLPARNVRRVHGSIVSMEFGGFRLKPVKRCGQKVIEKFSDWYLAIEIAAWRIDDKAGKPICGSEDSHKKIEKSLALFEDKELIAIHVLNDALDTKFEFADSLAITVFCMYTKKTYESWWLSRPDNNSLCISAGHVGVTCSDTAL
ncbi:MAG: hypothetical protein AB7R69_04455 [Candidatus Babeliales bacterium]